MSVPKKKPTKKRAVPTPRADASDLEAVIRDAILKCGRSVNDIAKQAEVSQSVLSRFVRGERTITLPVASRVCVVLQLRLILVAAT
jgi:ribosome-binding protein aMBF1 (putative translation factor)